jgi:outer membrane protein TolC
MSPATPSALRVPVLLLPLLAPASAGQEQAPPEPLPEATLEQTGRPIDLSIEDALRLALENNLALKIEAVSVEIARYEYVGTWGAFDPLLGLDASYSDGENELGGGGFPGVDSLSSKSLGYGGSLDLPFTTGGAFTLGFDGVSSNSDNPFGGGSFDEQEHVLSLVLSQPLLRGAWSKYATTLQRESELVYEQQRESARRARQDLLLAASRAYWDLVNARAQQLVAVRTLELGMEQLERDQRRLEVGVGTEVDVLQSETNVAAREQELLLANVRVKLTEDALKVLIFERTEDRSVEEFVDWWARPVNPTTPLAEGPEKDESDEALRKRDWIRSLSVALERRSELLQQRYAIRAQEVRVTDTVGNRKAQLDATLAASSRGLEAGFSDSVDESLAFDFGTYTAGLVFSTPIRNRTARNAELAARAGLRAARLTYDQLELDIVNEVRDAVRNADYQEEAVRAARKSVDLAERQLEAENARFQEGLSTTFFVLQFQQQLAVAESELARARVDLAKSVAFLQRSEGVIGEVPPE